MIIHINFSPVILFTINFYQEINFTNYKIPCVIQIKISGHFKLLIVNNLLVHYIIVIYMIENLHEKINLF